MKKKLLTLSAVLLLFVTLAFWASAVTLKEFKTNSTFVPVTYSSHKSTSSVTLYGNADYLCMKTYSETNNVERFCIEIFSDSKRTKKILEYANTFKKGTTYEDIIFDLTSLKSKTYYATSYVMKQSTFYHDQRLVKDSGTVKNFKIVVKRDGTTIKNMKCFMYGYENTYYGPAIYWYSVPGATKYYVYKYVDKQYKKIATVKANGEDFNYYIDKSLKDKNSTAHYKVKALNGTGSTALSLNKVKAVTLKTPTVKTELLSYGIKVSWSKPKSSCTYVVLRSTNGGEWEQIKETTSLSYTDKFLENGVIYRYTVIAYNKTAVSGYHPTGSMCRYVSPPALKSVKATEDGKIKVEWNNILNTTSYNVYRKASDESDWTKIANVNACEYIDDTCQRNKVYTYNVRGVVGKDQSLFESKGKTAAVIDTPVLNDIVRTEEGFAKISWEAMEGVSYKVYRKTADSSWTFLKTTSSTEYIDKSDLANGKEYIYTVKSCIGSVNGTYDKNGKRFVYLKPIVFYNPESSTGGIKLNWSTVVGAQEYIIYRKTADSEFVRLASCTDGRYFDETAEKAVSYEYKITYVINSVEQIDYPSYKSCIISAEPLALADEESAQYYGGYFAGWQVKVKDYNSESTYFAYEKTDSGWKSVQVRQEKNLITVLCDKKSKTTFFITEVKKDGTIRISPPEGYTFEIVPVCKTVFQDVDYKKGTANITWKPVEGADKYYLYKNHKIIGIYDTVTVCPVSGLEPNTNVLYSVSAVKGYSVGDSETEEINVPGLPKISSVKAQDGSIKVSWNVDQNCSLYRKAEGESKWTLLKAKITQDWYIDTDVKSNKTYYYTLAAIGTFGEEGRYNEKGVGITYLDQANVKAVGYYSTYLKIAWEKVPQAKYYKVYRRASTSDKFKLVYTTEDAKTVKYTDKNVKSGQRYYYYVKAYSDKATSKSFEKWVYYIAPPKNLTAKKVDGGIKLSFDKVEGASRLLIYRKSGNGDWKKIDRVKKNATSYTDKTAKKGVKYSYCIKSYYTTNKLYSAKSNIVSCKR